MFTKSPAPVIALGSWLRTLKGCTGYDAPLEDRFGHDGKLLAAEWKPPEGAVIGPVVEVRVTDASVLTLVNGFWIQVWWRTRGRQPLGVTFAQQWRPRQRDWQ